MYYVINSSSNLVLATCMTEPSITEKDWAKVRGGEFKTLDEAIAMGAQTLNKRGKLIWLGVNIKVKIENRALYGKWLGKWRAIAHYSGRKPRPSDTWILLQLNRVMRVNIPLDPETKLTFHWDEPSKYVTRFGSSMIQVLFDGKPVPMSQLGILDTAGNVFDVETNYVELKDDRICFVQCKK